MNELIKHYFDVELAEKYGIGMAIIIRHLAQEIVFSYNLDNNLWICKSIENLKEELPYFSENKIRYIIRKLKAKNIIHVKRFSKNEKGEYQNCYTIVDEEILEMFGLN